MKGLIRISILAFAVALFSAGCGAGGDDDGGGGGGGGATTVSGTASKGGIEGGTANVFALGEDGERGELLGTDTTDSNGEYSVDVGDYTGNVLVEVTGGTYVDEATGETVTNPDTFRAVLTGAEGSVSVMATPATEIACRVAEAATGLTTDNITSANSLVGAMVGGIDILGTRPADVTDQDDSRASSVDGITYGLFLATLSQMVLDEESVSDIEDAISRISSDLQDGKLDLDDSPVLTPFLSFLENENNNSGVHASHQTKLDDSLVHMIGNQLTPFPGGTGLDNTVSMVSELRNTSFSFHNIVDGPYQRVSDDVNVITNDLADTFTRIGWIIDAVHLYQPLTNYPIGDQGHTIDISYSFVPDEGHDTGFDEAAFQVYLGETLVDQGEATLDDTGGFITDGDFNALMGTSSGPLSLDTTLSYSASSNGTIYTDMSFSGSATSDNIDMSLNPLTITYAPREGRPDLKYPQTLYADTDIETNSSYLNGQLMTDFVWNPTGRKDNGVCGGAPLPKKVFYRGAWGEVDRSGEVPVRLTPTVFEGTLDAKWFNAMDYNACIDEGPDNFVRGRTFLDGTFTALERPTLGTFWKFERTEFDRFRVDASYTNYRLGGTFDYTTGSVEGPFDTSGDDDFAPVFGAKFKNKFGLELEFTYNGLESCEDQLTGSVNTRGGERTAELFNRSIGGCAPWIRFSDGFIQTVF